MAKKKTAHEVLVEETGLLLGKITILIEMDKAYDKETVCLAQTLKILQQIKIPADELSWVKEGLSELATRYHGKVSHLEELISICMDQILSENLESPARPLSPAQHHGLDHGDTPFD